MSDRKHIDDLGLPDEDAQNPHHEAPHLDPEMSDVPTTSRRRRAIPLSKEIPLLLWLVAAWLAMTRQVDLMNILFGILIAWVVTHVFRLPPVELSGRFNLGKALVMIGRLVGQAFVASFRIFKLALLRGPKTQSSILRIPLVTHDDLILTAVSHCLAIVPGSIVCEVDRDRSILYLHVLGTCTEESASDIIRRAQLTELQVLEIMGTRTELELARSCGAGREIHAGRAALASSADRTTPDRTTQETDRP
jgi:multicomponent Na+:H+ antiporter subunit E